MKIKILIIVSLIISGLMAYLFETHSKGFVIHAPYGTNEYIYLKDIQGSMSDGGIALGFFGLICLFIGVILMFIKNTTYFIRVGFIVFLFLLLSFMMLEGGAIDQLIINTIQYDHNIYLILWIISFTLYTIFLSILNISQNHKQDTF